MVLTIFLTILSVIFLVFFESFLLALFNFRFSIVLFFFLFRKINWKLLFFPFLFLLLIFDIVKSFPLGTNLLIFSFIFLLFILISLLLSVETGFTAFFVRIFLFAIYYILLLTLPSFLTIGTFGSLSLRNVLVSFLKGVVSALLLVFFDNAYSSFRKRGNSSQISIK